MIRINYIMAVAGKTKKSGRSSGSKLSGSGSKMSGSGPYLVPFMGENSLYEKVPFWLEKFHKFISFSKNS